jgi:hypothetical protein
MIIQKGHLRCVIWRGTDLNLILFFIIHLSEYL